MQKIWIAPLLRLSGGTTQDVVSSRRILAAKQFLSSRHFSQRAQSASVRSTCVRAIQTFLDTLDPSERTNKLWMQKSVRRRFFEFIREQRGLQEKENWYESIDLATVVAFGGSGMISRHYKNVVSRAIEDLFPEVSIQVWKLKKCPRNWWSKVENQRKYLDWLAEEKGFSTQADWYSLTAQMLKENHGARLAQNYNYNIFDILKAVYPEKQWIATKFTKLSSGYWDSPQNRRSALEEAAATLGITSPEQWYSKKLADLEQTRAYTFVAKNFKGSMYLALKDAFPEHRWLGWRFSRVPMNWWSDLANQREFVQEVLVPKLNIRDKADWYKLNESRVQQAGAGRLLALYENSIAHMLTRIYPDHEWQEWRFIHVPRGFWSTASSIKRFFLYASSQLQIRDLSDWYRVRPLELAQVANRCRPLRGSASVPDVDLSSNLPNMLAKAYPEHKWELWRFEKVPEGFWKSLENQRVFLNSIGQAIGIESERGLEGWYSATTSRITQAGGNRILRLYNNSLVQMLQTVFPEHRWQVWKFESVPQSYWQSLENQRRLFDDLFVEMELKALKDWYSVSLQDEKMIPARSVLQTHYNSSLHDALKILYPEHQWLPFEFAQQSRTA